MMIRATSFVLLISAMIFGNTYYIDYSGGSDANPGTSKAAPWKASPGMNGFSASYTHAAGDVFIFKGGVVWPAGVLPFTIVNSGTAGKTDTYTTDHSWYSGSAWARPVFDGQLFGKTLLSASGVSYVKINDLKFINAGSLSANGIMGAQLINCSYIELSNNAFALESWGCLYISTEKSGDYYDILVHHNDISHCAFAMRFVPAAAASIMHNVQAYNNDIHDFHSQLSGAVHGDGIQHYCSPDNAASYDRYIDGFKIFNNHFFGDFTQVAGSGGAMTALVYLSGASVGVQIYNNVFAPQYSGTQSPNFFESFISLRDNPNRGGHHKIYNNTFVTPVAAGQSAAILEDDTRYPAPGLDIKNNILSNFNWPFDLRSTNHTIDNNDDHFIRDIGKWAGNFIGSFVSWQALGLDVHGQSIAPVFASSTDQHLSAASPCIGKGANLSTFFTTDIEGKSRPASGAFSLGAYEFGATQLPTVPAKPVLLNPSNGATGVAVIPTLAWNAVSGAVSYSLQVSTDSACASTKINQAGITSASYQTSSLANNTKYYWRVCATNANGTGGWSSTGNFQTVAIALPAAPTLSSPVSGATGVAVNPALSWNAVSGAASYSLQVSTVSGFATTILNQSGITTASYQVNGLLNNTAYYWRVNATNTSGASNWSSTGNFTTVVPAPPAALVLWWPGNGAKGVVINPSLTWSPVSGATSYALQVSTVSGFATAVVNQSGITTNSFEVSGLSGSTIYYWRVNVTSASGTSGWSSAGNFTTIATAPSAPVLSLPASGALRVSVNPTLSWNTVAGAASYSVQVSTISSFATTLVNQSGITANSYKVTGLSNSTAYYWRVNATNATGVSGWSSSGNFTTDAAPSPTLVLWWPGSGATGVVINPSLTWSPDSGAISYSLQVSADSGFAAVLLDKSGITANSFEVSGLSNSTSYFWRVCVTKATGASGWSQSAKFTVGSGAPKISTASVSGAIIPIVPSVLDIFSCNNGAVQISLPFPGAFRLAIYSMSGQKVAAVSENSGSTGYNTVSLKNLTIPKGYYLMQLSVNGGVINRKISVFK